MGILRGQTEAEKFRAGKRLTLMQSVKAQCFMCNGDGAGANEDCSRFNEQPLLEPRI